MYSTSLSWFFITTRNDKVTVCLFGKLNAANMRWQGCTDDIWSALVSSSGCARTCSSHAWAYARVRGGASVRVHVHTRVLMYGAMSAHETVYRKDGKRIDPKLERLRKRKEEMKKMEEDEQFMQWGRG